MPREGWPFLENLKKSARTRDMPIVAMSDCVPRSVEERAEREGLAAFLPKRCLPDELAEGLRRVLDQYTCVRVCE